MSIIHKYNLGIIGNCSYIGYIDLQANIKWLCMPRFDSSFIFGSLLDENDGGEFSVKPANDDFSSTQYYIENTNILITEFSSYDGKFRVIDFAPRFYQYSRYFKPLMICRKIELIEGRPSIVVCCEPVGNYGKIKPETVVGSNHIRFLIIGDQIRLTTNIPLTTITQKKAFVLSENKHLVFTYGDPLEAELEETVENFLIKTKKYWRGWIKSTSIPDIYQKEIIRSALVLKLHQYEDTGGIIASGTTSLPEFDKSTRNWDYRYTWIRDSYYTLTAFNSIGHFEELEKYFQFIENIIAHEDHFIQPLYSITGEKKLVERLLDLEGYLKNAPVRIGNDAYRQIQHDVYGQLLISIAPIYTDQRLSAGGKHRTLKIVEVLLDLIEEIIDEPDSGIWEFRNKKQHHCYTYLFHWAGGKAAMKISKMMNDASLYGKAESIVNKAAIGIEKCYDTELHAYTQAIGVKHMDASTLKLITLNYLSPGSEKAKKHLLAIERSLKTEQGLIYRYLHEDDFGKPETTFLVCSFWYVESLACVGRLDEAIKTFENLLQYSNPLGLFSEDVDIHGGQWGNFPQTYSHVGLMNSAFRISKKRDLPLFF